MVPTQYTLLVLVEATDFYICLLWFGSMNVGTLGVIQVSRALVQMT